MLIIDLFSVKISIEIHLTIIHLHRDIVPRLTFQLVLSLDGLGSRYIVFQINGVLH